MDTVTRMLVAIIAWGYNPASGGWHPDHIVCVCANEAQAERLNQRARRAERLYGPRTQLYWTKLVTPGLLAETWADERLSAVATVTADGEYCRRDYH